MTPVKVKLKAIANVALILVALAVGDVVLAEYAASYATPRTGSWTWR